LAGGGLIDEAIIRDVSVEFSLDGILDTPTDEIRAFLHVSVGRPSLGELVDQEF